MFLDMATAGLVIIGSSKYDNEPSLNRVAFLEGSEKVVSYFKSHREGLGIDPRNVLNLFDSDDTPGHQRNLIQSFTRSRKVTDLFIYVIGHGFTKNNEFFIFQKTSEKADIHSSTNITLLLQYINSASAFRMFAFVDACSSGSLHSYDPVTQVMPVLMGYISNADSTHLPRSGMCILTANNKANIGLVLADDAQQEIREPLFTHELLKLLKSGKRGGQKFGLSFNSIREILEQRIEDELVKIDRRDLIAASKPEITDLTDFDNKSVACLSEIGMFPNNDPSNSLVIKAAKRVRFSYSHERNLNEEITQLNQEIESLSSSIKTKDITISDLENTNKDLQLKSDSQKTQIRKLTRRFYSSMSAAIVLFILIVTTISAFIVITKPEIIDNLLTLIKKPV